MNRNSLIAVAVFLWSVAASAAAPFYRIHIQDYIIHPVTAEYIERAIHQAETEKAQGLLIVLDTPGGLLQTTRGIVKEIMNAEVPVIVYVAPAGARAASAGVFITLAAHVAAMAPTTHIGAAHPVQLGEGGEGGPLKKIGESMEKEKREKPDPKSKNPMTDKILQDTLAWVETIAKARDRNVRWAKKAVEESVSITAEEAKKIGVIDLIASSEEELLKKLDGREIRLPQKTVILATQEAPVISIPMNWRQSILNILINPNIAYILMILGFYGLLFEITHPGSWGPGIAGLICILLAFYSFHIIPPNFAGIILTGLGLLLFAAEVFVASHGLLALGGIVCLFLGGLFLVDAPAEFLKVSLQVIVPAIVGSLLLLGLLLTLVVKSQRRKTVTGEEGLVSLHGVADTELNPEGQVSVEGEIWNAVAETPVRKGEKVAILGVENLKLRVKKI